MIYPRRSLQHSHRIARGDVSVAMVTDRYYKYIIETECELKPTCGRTLHARSSVPLNSAITQVVFLVKSILPVISNNVTIQKKIF